MTAERLPRRAWLAIGLLATAFVAWLVTFAETGVDDLRVANPDPPNPLAPIEWVGASVTDFWVPIFYGVTFAVMGLLGWVFIRHWRRTGQAHAGWPLFVAIFVVGFFGDPLFNWAMYCNYHPDLLHWPVDWNLMNVAPSVEPLWILMGAYPVFFLAPALLAIALFRGLIELRAKPGSFVRRHPGWSLFVFAVVFGSGMDILMEQWMLNMRIYKYTQIAGPELTWGEGHLQVYEIIWIGLLIGFYAALMHRDDTGASLLTRISRRGPVKRVRAGEMGTAFVLITISLVLYGGFWTVLRETGRATNIPSSDYPYRAIKTYDPDGMMRSSGQPGPYFPGTWCIGNGCRKG